MSHREEKTYLWSHEPFLTGQPIERIRHSLMENQEGELDEVAVFKLDNGKFLFIRFCGNLLNLEEGITDLEEFDAEEDAVKLYQLLFFGDVLNG